MLKIILTCLIQSIVYSARLEYGDQYLKIINVSRDNDNSTVEMLSQQTKRIVKYNDSKTTIAISVETNTPSMLECTGISRNVLFDQYDRNSIQILNMSTHSYYTDDSLKLNRSVNFNSPDFIVQNPILIQLVSTKYGLFALTSNHNLLVLSTEYNKASEKFFIKSTKSYNFSEFRQNQYEQQTPQLLWNDEKQIIFIIYPQQIVIGKVSVEEVSFKNSNISISDEQSYLGNGKIYREYLFLSRGKLGIDIYQISDQGDLNLVQNLKNQLEADIINLFIIDFDFGGFDHNYIFVLDQFKGLMIYSIEMKKFTITKWLDQIIPIESGKLVKTYQQTVLILSEHNSYNEILEYCIYTQDYKLFYMKTHYLDGKYFDIEIGEQFAIVRGYDSHRIIYHSIHQSFEQYHSNPVTLENWLDENEIIDDQQEYLTLPQLQSFVIHKYHDLDYLVAVTTRKLTFLRFMKVDPYVECTLSKNALEGSQITVKAVLNSTWCQEKFKQQIASHSDPLYPSLIMCKKEAYYTVIVGKDLESEKKQYFYYVTLTIITLILLFGLLIFLKHFFRNQRKEQVQLENVVADLSNRTYQKETSPDQVSGF